MRSQWKTRRVDAEMERLRWEETVAGLRGANLDPLRQAYRVRLEERALTRQERTRVRGAFMRRNVCTGPWTWAAWVFASCVLTFCLAMVAVAYQPYVSGYGAVYTWFALWLASYTALVLVGRAVRRNQRERTAEVLHSVLRVEV